MVGDLSSCLSLPRIGVGSIKHDPQEGLTQVLVAKYLLKCDTLICAQIVQFERKEILVWLNTRVVIDVVSVHEPVLHIRAVHINAREIPFDNYAILIKVAFFKEVHGHLRCVICASL